MQVLDHEKIKHGPMIGKMYEGLTRDMLSRAVFDGLDLRVVQGVIRSKDHRYSAQIDCMIVCGEGRSLPYSDDFEYEIDQVVAIVEVKKTLYSNELIGAYQNLLSAADKIDDASPAGRELRDAWRGIMRTELPSPKEAEFLPAQDSMILKSLFLDSILPVRIALGYHGFASEFSLRESFAAYLEKNETTDPENPKLGFGPHSFPNLILAGQNALVKLNGMPFSASISSDGWWPVYGSISGRSMQVLLEVLWTRLAYRFRLGAAMFGEDLSMEYMSVLIDARRHESGNLRGWQYRITEIDREILDSIPKEGPWEPVELTFEQFVALGVLAEQDEIDIKQDDDFLAFLQTRGLDVGHFIRDFLKTGLVYLGPDSKLRYLTDECASAILADGRMVAGENKTGRFARWVTQYAAEGNGNLRAIDSPDSPVGA